MQRLLAGRQLGHPRYGNYVRGQYSGAHEHQPVDQYDDLGPSATSVLTFIALAGRSLSIDSLVKLVGSLGVYWFQVVTLPQ